MTDRPPLSGLLLDIDSTLYPLGPILRRHMRELYGISATEEQITAWSFWKLFGLSDRDGMRIVRHSHHPREILAAQPFEGAVEAVNRWHDAGVAIHVVSDRRAETTAPTLAWLARIGLRYTTFRFAPGVDKVAYVREQGLDLAIDDKPEFIAAASAAGIPVATLRYAYNRQLADALGIISADEWPALAAGIEHAFQIERRSAA